MESRSKSKKNNDSKSSIPLSSPIKSLQPMPTTLVSDQIATPEKSFHRPPRTRNRRMALSIKEVKQIAQGLQSNNRQPSDRSASDLDPLPVEAPKPSRAKAPVKLPEKYEILSEFFNSMESSIRLLKLKGSSPTFPSIGASIQNLTERRFTYGHLARLKYILPEGIVIKKVNLHDAVTSCVKPELHVTLQVDAFEDAVKGKGETGYTVLRRVFRERLADFAKRHPEGDDVPEVELPHPFGQTKSAITLNESSGFSVCPPIISLLSKTQSQQEFGAASHMSRAFQRRFSQKILLPDAQKTPLSCYNNPPRGDSLVHVAPSPVKCTPKPPLRRKSLFRCPIISPSSSIRTTHEEVAKMAIKSDSISQKEVSTSEGTPAKLVSTPARLMAATPEIQTPKRRRPPVDCDITPLRKSARRTTQTKLLFSPPKKNATKIDEETEAGSSSVVNDIIGFLPESLLQSVREKERKASEEKDAGAAEAKKRQKLIACLPSTFDMILLLFQSRSRSVMTKQELTHKLIANNCKIVDRGEVEEQLKLLRELVPDWISEKMASTGDILYSVNKLSSPEELRQRLVEAE